jgi:hypothetical protein
MIGIDISPTACRVMAKRLRDVCALPESEPLWRAGRGFVVRDLPWTVEKLRVMASSQRDNRKLARHEVSGIAEKENPS